VKPQDSQVIRTLLLAILTLGVIGNGVELLLLGHDETLTQLVPLILIAVGLVAIVWHAAAGSSLSLLLMRITMGLFIGAGGLGIALHYRGSVEFQKEVDPSLRGFALFAKAIRSKAPPALAPGIMAELGLLGLVCTLKFIDRREA
jgi:hypothetical protein